MKTKIPTKAKKELLDLANAYEVKKRKYLKNIYFDPVANAYKWKGLAHDYTYFI